MEEILLKWIPPIILGLGFSITWWRDRKNEIKRQADFENQVKQMAETLLKPHTMIIECQNKFDLIIRDISEVKSDMGSLRGSVQTLISMLNMRK